MTGKLVIIRVGVATTLWLCLPGCSSDTSGSSAPAQLSAGKAMPFAESGSAPAAEVPDTEAPASLPPGFFGASAAACDADYNVMRTAIDAYLTLHGDGEATEQDLIDAGLLREPSRLYDVGAHNTVVASPDSGCVS
jgi:hypothetical protein